MAEGNNSGEKSHLIESSKSATEYVNEVVSQDNTPHNVGNDLSDIKAPGNIQNDNPMNRIDRNDNTTQSSDEKTKKELTDWANEVLSLNNKPRISDLIKSISDGTTLFKIVKFISGAKLYYAVPKPESKQDRVTNLCKCLEFLRTRRVDIATIHPEELEDGCLEKILLLVTKIRKHFQTHTDWVNEVLEMKHLPPISDLRKSVGDGETIPNILESINCVKRKPQTKEERVKNLRKCLDFLRKREVDISTIKPEELEDGNLKTILLLVKKIRKHFQAHTDWVNEVLEMKHLPPISDLRKSVRDGKTIPTILEIISGTTLDCVKRDPQTKEERVDNLRKCLEFLSERDVDIATIHPEELEDGNMKTIRLLVKKIRKHFQIMGCMTCRLPTQLTSFSNDSLVPGDHIEIDGNSSCFGDCYNHHAIVKEVKDISDDGQIAEVHVIDIPSKKQEKKDNNSDSGQTARDTSTKKNCLHKCFCCDDSTNMCGCPHETVIKDHPLYERHISCKEIRRIDYRIRMFDKDESIKKAQKLIKPGTNEGTIPGTYCLCCRNCEHFTAAMINVKINSDTNCCTKCLSCCCFSECCSKNKNQGFDNVCSQSVRLIFLSFHFVVWLVQVLFFFGNFYSYAIVAEKDSSFKHWFIPNWLINFVSDTCYHTASNTTGARGFETWCDWYSMLIIQAVFFVMFLLVLIRYHCCLNICALCKISHILLSLFKMIWFLLVDVFNIFFEKIFYFGLSGSDSPAFVTWLIIIGLSICETVLAYQLAHVCKTLVMCLCCRTCECCCKCCNCCCKGCCKGCCKCFCKNGMICVCCCKDCDKSKLWSWFRKSCNTKMDKHYYKYKVV